MKDVKCHEASCVIIWMLYADNPFLIPPLLSTCNAKCPYHIRPLKNVEETDPFK